VLTLPGDVGGLELPRKTPVPRFVDERRHAGPDDEALRRAAGAINAAGSVAFALLVGIGARDARDEVLQLAEQLSAPMVLTLKAKERLESDNEYEISQSGLIGNPATSEAFSECDLLLLVGTDFPYREFLPTGKTVVQLDIRSAHIGRRTPVDHALVGDARLGLRGLTPLLEAKTDRRMLDKTRSFYESWQEQQTAFADPDYERKPTGLLRRKLDNPDELILLDATQAKYVLVELASTRQVGAPTEVDDVAGLKHCCSCRSAAHKRHQFSVCRGTP